MLRKLILLITVMMPALMWGQLAVGSWMLYSPYRNVERMEIGRASCRERV